jgi:uncharacterized membrane protein YhaH (DUF805 family)
MPWNEASKGGGSMNFGQAITSGFSNYVNFSDRASRSEYWFWILFYFICLVVAIIIDSVLRTRVLTAVVWLGIVLPTLALSVRRLHDLDRSGWWLLLALIPLIGSIVLLIWFCTRGTDGSNRFGPDPLAGIGQITQRPAV